MKVILKFNKTYFILFILLFIVEVLIALYVHDNFVRPFVGDVLVVILIYCFILSFFKFSKIKTIIFVLLFAFGVEFLQYLNFIQIIGLEKNKLARTVLGNSFAVEDLLCYVFGIGMVILTDKCYSKFN